MTATNASNGAFIGFPPPLLGPRPLRLPLLWNGDDAFAIDLPAGVLASYHEWFPEYPLCGDAINLQASLGKPELERMGIPHANAVYVLEPEIAGIALFAKNSEAATAYRNAFGSSEFSFTFEFISAHKSLDDSAKCNLPMARHATKPTMLVSHTTGKQAETRFEKIDTFGRYSQWRATTAFPRIHQICLHAKEAGLPIVGDTTYGKLAPLVLADIKQDFRPGRGGKGTAPLYDAPAARLARLDFKTRAGDPVTIEADPPRGYATLLKKLAEFA